MKQITNYINEKANFIVKKHIAKHEDSEIEEFCRFVCEYYGCRFDEPDDTINMTRYTAYNWIILNEDFKSFTKFVKYINDSPYEENVKTQLNGKGILDIYYNNSEYQDIRIMKGGSGIKHKLIFYNREKHK